MKADINVSKLVNVYYGCIKVVIDLSRCFTALSKLL